MYKALIVAAVAVSGVSAGRHGRGRASEAHRRHSRRRERARSASSRRGARTAPARRAWTDDFDNILSAVRLGGKVRTGEAPPHAAESATALLHWIAQPDPGFPDVVDHGNEVIEPLAISISLLTARPPIWPCCSLKSVRDCPSFALGTAPGSARSTSTRPQGAPGSGRACVPRAAGGGQRCRAGFV
jgi:hypothetical protein